MRLIGTLENEESLLRLSSFLKRKGIEIQTDSFFDVNTGHLCYQVWVLDEDRIEEAERDLAEFAKQSSHPRYDTPAIEISPSREQVSGESVEPKSPSMSPFTLFIIAICTFIFLLNWTEEPANGEAITPIQEALLFDVPTRADAPFWQGGYEWILFKLKGEPTASVEGPLFEKIREGEIWRLFSPALLHVELLHILFNMLWVWILCRPIEQKIGPLRLLVLSLIVGIGSNIAQYLMGGPFFIGYSGVVMGLAGFTWQREKIAPWEGYPMTKATQLFLLLFVVGMFGLQFLSFLFQAFTSVQFSPNIANTAHIAGALLGAILGRFSFFAEGSKR